MLTELYFFGVGGEKVEGITTHLFEQMHYIEVHFEKMTLDMLIDLVFTQFVHRGMQQLEKTL